MNEAHQAYLSLGSNINPEASLVRAVEYLLEYGNIVKVSNAWESKSVGAQGPNYLNACVLFMSPFTQAELKEKVIRPIESRLGRERSENKYAPRTIDIDIVMFDNKLCDEKFWELAFVMVPLADIYPEYQNPTTRENIGQTTTRLRQQVWMEARREVLSLFNGSRFGR